MRDDNKRGCPVKGCPWRGRPEDCPFPHYDRDDGDTHIDRLMQERPDGRRRR